MRSLRRPMRVLLVEDDAEDANLLADAVKSGPASLTLHRVEDGAKALDYLRRRGAYEGAARPDLVLLDLHLPVKEGLAVLREIKADEVLRVIPVIAFTSSSNLSDVWAAYSAGVNCYVSKPVGLRAICDFVNLLCSFWSVAKLPPAGPA